MNHFLDLVGEYHWLLTVIAALGVVAGVCIQYRRRKSGQIDLERVLHPAFFTVVLGAGFFYMWRVGETKREWSESILFTFVFLYILASAYTRLYKRVGSNQTQLCSTDGKA